MLRQQKCEDAYTHLQAKRVKLRLSRKQSVVCDDFAVDAMEFEVRVVPQALQLFALTT